MRPGAEHERAIVAERTMRALPTQLIATMVTIMLVAAVLGLDRLPGSLPRNMQSPRDLPHRLTLHEICTRDPPIRFISGEELKLETDWAAWPWICAASGLCSGSLPALPHSSDNAFLPFRNLHPFRWMCFDYL